ncbi:hypothetical protein UlMin_038643 [Ulmus minor]
MRYIAILQPIYCKNIRIFFRLFDSFFSWSSLYTAKRFNILFRKPNLIVTYNEWMILLRYLSKGYIHRICTCPPSIASSGRCSTRCRITSLSFDFPLLCNRISFAPPYLSNSTRSGDTSSFPRDFHLLLQSRLNHAVDMAGRHRDIGYQASLTARRHVVAIGPNISISHAHFTTTRRRYRAEYFNFPCMLQPLQLGVRGEGIVRSIATTCSRRYRIIFGASKKGIVYMWDLRGGKSSTAFQSHKEICQSPLTSFKLASLIEKITPLKEQSDIVAKEIHPIDLNPSCPYQLAFHLHDGWSGVLDLYYFQVTHIHCPPPAWLNESTDSSDPLCLRKPSWLPTDSIYVVGSSYDNGTHLLDFYPDSSSTSHVDFKLSEENNQNKQNIFVPSSEGITACAAHPLNGTIIARTKNSSLLMISQRHQSC